MPRPGMAVHITLLVVLVAPVPVFGRGNSRAAQTEAALKDLLHAWRSGGGWQPYRGRPSAVRAQNQQIHSAVKNIFGGLKTLGLLPRGSAPQPGMDKSLDRNRLSGFLYNISMYLQGVGEAKDNPHPSDQDQFWENVLYSFLQLNQEGLYSTWDGKVAPRPTFKMLDLFLSLRGSPHWNGLLGLVQAIASLSGQQNQRHLLTFFSQNWRMISALLDATLQGLLSGTYGQASAGVQGFICILKGRDDCAFNVGWLQQLMDFLETRNWKPVINLHPAILAGEHHTGAPSAGRFKPFSMLPEAFREDSHPTNQTRPNTEDLGSMSSLLLQALSRSSPAEPASRLAEPSPVLLKGLDGLRRGLLHRVGSSVYGNLRKKVSHVTDALLDEVSSLVGVPHPNQHGKCSVGDLRQLILWGIRNNLTWNAQALGFISQGPPTRPQFRSCPSFQEDGRSSRPLRPAQRPRSFKPQPSRRAAWKRRSSEYLSSAEILEAACNDSIPGLSGVSNFTVFLYCNLFEGNDDGTIAEAGHVGPDLHTSCSDAAWYLSAAEEDFLWVHVCSEFFAREFNNTVCANSSFWLRRAQQASMTQDYQYLNRSSIDELCVQLSSKTSGGSGPDPDDECLMQLRTRSLSARDFRRCFLPNSFTLITSLCGNDSEPYPHGGGWAAEYCSRVLHNDSSAPLGQEPCDYEHWGGQRFMNHTLLQLCAETEGLKEHVCLNATLLHPLAAAQPWLLGWCSDLGLEPAGGGEKCFLQRVFDMLPAPYNFDTSRLCASPAPFLLEALYSLSQCEGGRDERVGWLGAVRYVLRVLDFVVGISAGLEEGESDVRQGLSQAILLSSLLDNTSFWGTLRPNASLSVLHTIGLFLRKEQDPSLKEDLLSCFSPVLWDLIQREDNSSALRVLFQEYLQMPRESIRTLVMTAEKDAVKRFLSHVRQSWDQLQVETAQASQKEQQAMETMTSAFIHKFTRVTPDLFVDLSQFIPFMSVSDIMTFPTSLMVNDSVLMAIRDHSSEMKSPQKRAFVKRLLQTKVVEEVPSWPAYFLSSILPLLPYVPVCYFQRLTVQQLSPLVEVLGNSSLDATRGRHVLRTVFSKSKNLTCVDVSRLGTLACYLNPEELHQLLMVSPPLWRQLGTCVSEGHASSTGRLSHWLALAVRHLDASSLSPQELSALRGLLPHLGASFLQPFSTPRLLQILSQPGLPSYPPAQAFRILTKLTQEVNAISQEEDVSGAALDLLGPLMPFLDRDTFGQVEQESLRLRLDEMKGYCLPQDTMKEMARILTQRDLLGDPATWTIEEVEHTGRLLFALSPSQIASIPLDVLRPDVVEQVLESQKSWEDSEVGQSCKPLGELVEKRENLVRGIVRRRGRRRKEPVPGCADIKGTFPSAWSATQLGRMEEEELANCVEDLAQDDSLSPEQRRALWARLRQSYGPAKSLTREQILELGCLVMEMSERELQDANLADLGTVTHLGAWRGWTPKKVRAAMMSFLRHSDLKLEELEATELASLGNLLCGLSPMEISRLDPKHLSMATLFLRELHLPCSEQQMEALLSQLSRPQGFGSISSWGPEIFTEIGNLAVGLPDIVLSALVREQVEGLTPEVIGLIPPTKMAVALSSPQFSWLTVEQASAVTEEQWSELGGEQKRALAMALYEGDLPLEHRGRNLAPLAWSPDCLTVWLLCLSYLLKNALLLP
ncbi:stereocilin isoform X3 [Paramormyrops kingsleyae]|uniref:stereocilin isoform X3 n=1 Tax=Paramormyrops kingsleyae TaxID=1676925 RepID=UPI000CD65A01|nr:stereocilin isoform X3 [Paramormyrops kingsleyae]